MQSVFFLSTTVIFVLLLFNMNMFDNDLHYLMPVSRESYISLLSLENNVYKFIDMSFICCRYLSKRRSGIHIYLYLSPIVLCVP